MYERKELVLWRVVDYNAACSFRLISFATSLPEGGKSKFASNNKNLLFTACKVFACGQIDALKQSAS